MLLILFLFLVSRESCCASQGQNIEQSQEQNIIGQNIVQTAVVLLGIAIAGVFILGLFILESIIYWYFDLHQKQEGWYTCKFYYAAGYRTKLFYNRIYLDFFSSFPQMITGLCQHGLLALVGYSFLININVRIYRDFYIVFTYDILMRLLSLFTGRNRQEEIEQEEIDN